MTSLDEPGTGTPVDRAIPVVGRARALSSRLSSILAIALMSVLGVGMLVWYYATMMSRQSAVRTTAQETARHRAQGDAPLPSLGTISAPIPESPVRRPGGTADEGASVRADAPAAALTGPPPNPSLLGAGTLIPAGESPNPSYANMSVRTSAQTALERQLGGSPFAAQAASVPPVMPVRQQSVPELTPGSSREAGTLAWLMKPTIAAAVQAEMLPSMRMLLPKGAFIDCTLETAIDSTLPGMTTCITATDTFGADGKVVLLERGTKLVGETRGQVQPGAARVFVLWNEARTPTGVVVPLASPGADELGRAGLSGEVNHHFWERFGAAMLISVLDGAVQTTVQSSARAGGIIVSPAGSEGVATEALKATVSIPPSVQKAQGDRIQILVARDLDFRSVYSLRSDAAER